MVVLVVVHLVDHLEHLETNRLVLILTHQVKVIMVVIVPKLVHSAAVEEAAPVLLADLMIMQVMVVMEYKFLHHSKIHPLLQVISQIQLHSKEVVV